MEPTLRSDCDLCGAWASYAGSSVLRDGRRYAVLRCPNGHGDFEVWRPEWESPLLLAEIRAIAERLCRVRSGSDPEIRAALEMPVAPPPLGATRAEIATGVLSRASVQLWFAPGMITRSMLEREFGVGDPLPRTGPGTPHVFAWDARVTGAPAKVVVFASFASLPDANASAARIQFRIDPA